MASTKDFREFLADNELFDLGFEGYPFTWGNKQDDGLIQQRLDKGVANQGWMYMFPLAKISHVVVEGSDHSMQILASDGIILNVLTWKKTTKLNSWRRIEELREEIRRGSVDPRVRHDYIKGKENELEVALKEEEYYWKVKSRNAWLLERDKTVQRRRNNQIQGLKDTSGVWHKNTECMQDIAVNYFVSLFKSSATSQGGEVAGCVEMKVNDQDNEELIRPFLSEEIREAVFQIPATKFSRPDGFTDGFFQDH
ncbi:hypothetical protein ACFX2K_008663 [Malus domestica]